MNEPTPEEVVEFNEFRKDFLLQLKAERESIAKRRNKDAKCINCPFWSYDAGSEIDDIPDISGRYEKLRVGFCVRYPPQRRIEIVALDAFYELGDRRNCVEVGAFPVPTDKTDVCGEHPNFFLD